jgi:hypothetical protein
MYACSLQIEGAWQCSAANLQPLRARAQSLMKAFDYVHAQHVLRLYFLELVLLLCRGDLGALTFVFSCDGSARTFITLHSFPFRHHNRIADALSNEALDGVGWGGGLKLPDVRSICIQIAAPAQVPSIQCRPSQMTGGPV